MCDQQSTLTLSEIDRALARSDLYRFLSRAFAYPDEPLGEAWRRAMASLAALGYGPSSALASLRIPRPPQLLAKYI